MFGDFQSILAAESNDQFGYIDYLNHSVDISEVLELYSTQHKQLQEESIFRKIDHFSDPIYKDPQEHCRNSAFKKKVAALNVEYFQEKIDKKSHDTQKADQDKESLSSYSIEQRESYSYSKKKKPTKPKKSQKKNNKLQAEKDPYPTKNILPCFRPFFLNFIFEQYPQAKDLKIIRRILGKTCINLQDYSDLFTQPTVRPILAEYFKTNRLYRDLIQSRVQHKLKMIYLTKIPVFQEAFRIKILKGIN